MKWIGWTLALFLAVIAILDPMCCADGCTQRDAVATGQSRAGGDCPLCQPSFISRSPISCTPLGLIVGRTPVRSDRLPASAFHRSFEHPPRTPA
jgi:hypothetical protein